MASSGKQHYSPFVTFTDQPVIADPAALTGVALTDSSGGTAADTIPAQTGSYVEATQETTVASLARACNRNTADILSIHTQLKAITDWLQASGAAAAS